MGNRQAKKVTPAIEPTFAPTCAPLVNTNEINVTTKPVIELCSACNKYGSEFCIFSRDGVRQIQMYECKKCHEIWKGAVQNT